MWWLIGLGALYAVSRQSGTSGALVTSAASPQAPSAEEAAKQQAQLDEVALQQAYSWDKQRLTTATAHHEVAAWTPMYLLQLQKTKPHLTAMIGRMISELTQIQTTRAKGGW
jgi:hypothetical protein